MRYVAAFTLCVLGGNKNPSAKDIEAILSSVGITADKGAIDTVIKEFKGKNLEELMEQGRAKLASVPSGGGAAPAAAAATSDAPAKKEEKKKEEKPESEDDDDLFGGGLFD